MRKFEKLACQSDVKFAPVYVEGLPKKKLSRFVENWQATFVRCLGLLLRLTELHFLCF